MLGSEEELSLNFFGRNVNWFWPFERTVDSIN